MITLKTTIRRKQTGETLVAYKYLPANDQMQKWLNAYKSGNDRECNRIAATMPEKTEEKVTTSMSKNMKSAYKQAVQSFKQKIASDRDRYFDGYYLADLDGDGQTELMITVTDSDMIPYMNVYKYRIRAAVLTVKYYVYSNMPDAVTFHAYDGHPGIVTFYKHNGLEEVTILSLSDNKIYETYCGNGWDRHKEGGGFEDYTKLADELKNHDNETNSQTNYGILE